MARALTIPLLALLLVGCPKAPTDIELAQAPASLAVSATNGMADIVVVRPTLMGFAVSFGIEINGEDVGSIRSHDYVHRLVPPGPAEVVARAERDCKASFPVEADKAYYLEAIPKPGWWYARVQLELMDPETGMTAVLECEDQTRE